MDMDRRSIDNSEKSLKRPRQKIDADVSVMASRKDDGADTDSRDGADKDSRDGADTDSRDYGDTNSRIDYESSSDGGDTNSRIGDCINDSIFL